MAETKAEVKENGKDQLPSLASSSSSSPSSAASAPIHTPPHPRRAPVPPPPITPDLLPGSTPPPEVVPFLKSVLRSSAFLQGLKDEELHVSGKDLTELVTRARAVRFHSGETLIEQGWKGKDRKASQPLFVIQDGPCGVYVSKKHANNGQPVRVGSVAANEIVGDMALYADTPPSVSIKSEGEVFAWQIDKAAFDEWIASRPAVKHSLNQRTWLWSALAKNYLFRGLDDDIQKENLLSHFEPMKAGYQQPIVQFGERGDRFYVVEKGLCHVEVPQITGSTNTAAPSGAGSTMLPQLSHMRETDEEDVPASGKTGLAGRLVPDDRFAGRAWAGVNPHLPKVPMVKVADRGPSDTFGEIALLYNVPRCATVKCMSPDGCALWSVDASSFLTAASKGSLYLKHIFYQYASVRDANGECLMNQRDFFNALKHTKWSERDVNGKKIPTSASSDHQQLNDSTLKLMFHMADQSGDNLISFSEFVLLYSLLQAPFTRYQMAFRMFDKDRNGYIDRQEFIQVIGSLSNDKSHQMTAQLSKDPLIVELFGPESAKSTKQMTYAEFESLLSRDVLPSFLQDVSNDLKAVNSYWQQVDVALSQSYGDAFITGSTLSANGTKGSLSISWKSLVAGGVAGAVSRTLVSPLERLKLLFQMQGVPPKYTGVIQGLRLIHKEDGIKGYFRGNLSNVIRITPASAFQFFFYDLYKKLFYDNRKDLNPLERLGAGGMAGMTACVLTYPLDFIRARLTLQSSSNTAYKGIAHGMVTVVRESGVRGLFRGLWPSLVGVFPYIGIDMSVYETLRANLPPSMKNAQGDTARTALFCCGAVAGVVGQTIAYPLDLVRRRLQVQGFSGTQYHYQGGIISTMRQIVKQEGFGGLYHGMIPNYAKVVPAVAVSFVVYEQMRKVLDM